MTTSYELSLRLKELGVEQNGGEYYCVITLEDETVRYDKTQVSQMWEGEIIRCRALTLGEVVRMIKGVSVLHLSDRNTWWAFQEMDDWGNSELEYNNKYTTPEEAAGELLCETLKQKEVSNG